MTDRRRRNVEWKLNVDSNGCVSMDDAQLAVLMDIRDELQKLNRLLACHNFTNMPHVLKRIDKRLAKKVPLR